MIIVIRPATRADVPAIFTIRTTVRENALSYDELDALGITPASIGAMIESLPCAWIAEVEGRPAGFAMTEPDHACLFALFVAPAAEGRGIGRALARVATGALFAQHDRIWLETGGLTRAAGFWRRLGWGEDEPAGSGDIRLWRNRPPAD